MKNNFIGEILISIVLIVLLVFILNPLNFWMPDQAHMLMAVALGVIFMIFAGFIWKEKTTDERDTLHRSLASRLAYLVGTGLLSLGIIVQIMHRSVDSWLVIILGAMILSKIIGFIYSQIKH